MRERTYFYGMPLAGVGTASVESFRSYVQRLAFMHCLKPLTLFHVLFERFPWEGRMFALDEVIKRWTIQAGGELGGKMRDALRQATGVDISLSAFSTFKHLVADQHLAKLGRCGRYCPLCVAQPDAYGQLLWETDCVTACPIHRVRLRSALGCGADEADHLKRNEMPRLCNVCTTCGSVGFACVKTEPEPASDAEVWVATQVGQLLAAPPTVCESWTPELLRHGLHALVVAAYGGSVVRATREAGLSRSSVCVWIRGSIRPSFSPLLQLCQHAGADLVELFGGRFVRTDAIPAAHEPDVECAPAFVGLRAPRKQVDLFERPYVPSSYTVDVGEALVAASKLAEPPNVKRFAMDIGINVRTCSQKWPEQTALLVEASARYQRKLTQLRFDSDVASYQKIAKELDDEGQLVSAAQLQRGSGLVAFSRNPARVSAMHAVLERYAT